MGSGVLPIAKHNKKLYFLFSREWIHSDYDPGLWSDFGGTKENKETYKETAIREGYEESMGFIGSRNRIKQLITKYNIYFKTTTNYRTYIVLIKYDKNLPRRFRKHFTETLKTNPELVRMHNGLYEKDYLKWYTLEEIQENIHTFRPWYKDIIRQLLTSMKLRCL